MVGGERRERWNMQGTSRGGGTCQVLFAIFLVECENELCFAVLPWATPFPCPTLVFALVLCIVPHSGTMHFSGALESKLCRRVAKMSADLFP